ncbi:MATE family efflux transporter [uncultured Sphaerochaeta sp.]|uniref:MATE family efflux transporter n=1 Tax=uncultured Sphaerochaeta sp. TaxID=886478 RepID=UPI002A0A336B|nr:MATE family efflux transporter [uncultured Sphaerochaeta sp.]
MEIKNSITRQVFNLAIPVTLQSLFQSSLEIIDQIMVGQLGSVTIASVGMGSKYANLFTVTLAAIGTAASLMMAQYYGQKNNKGLSKTFWINSMFAFIITVLFSLPALCCPKAVMSLYTNEAPVIPLASTYLYIIALGFPPLFITSMLANYLRNTQYPRLPMIASIFSVIINTLLNYVLIFGPFGLPRLGLQGAAIATTISRYLECLIIGLLFWRIQIKSANRITWEQEGFRPFAKMAFFIGLPVLINEFLWGFGETIYAVIYGHMGTAAMAAITLTFPIQGLCIGLFSGVSTAGAILVGNQLGKKEGTHAYILAKHFVEGTIIGGIVLGILLYIASPFYGNIFKINSETYVLLVMTLKVFSIALWIKVSNMVLGGLLRSGGKTHITLYLDMIGTWAIGVPLGLIAAFSWHWSLPWVYAIITIEEFVRFVLGILIVRSKRWMKTLA